MCFPVVLGQIGAALGAGAATSGAAIATGSAALGVASSTLGFIGQRQTARAQERAQAVAMQQEQQRLIREQTAMRQREAQEQIASLQQRQQIAEETRKALARQVVATGEAGVGGASAQAVVNEFTAQEGRYLAALEQQRQFQALNTGLALGDAGMASQRNITAINRPVQKPSFLEGIASIGSAGASGYYVGQRMYEASTLPTVPTSSSSSFYGPFQQTSYDKDANGVPDLIQRYP
jgi:hypothetical protein